MELRTPIINHAVAQNAGERAKFNVSKLKEGMETGNISKDEFNNIKANGEASKLTFKGALEDGIFTQDERIGLRQDQRKTGFSIRQSGLFG